MSDIRGRGGKAARRPALTRRRRHGDSMPVPRQPSRTTATPKAQALQVLQTRLAPVASATAKATRTTNEQTATIQTTVHAAPVPGIAATTVSETPGLAASAPASAPTPVLMAGAAPRTEGATALVFEAEPMSASEPVADPASASASAPVAENMATDATLPRLLAVTRDSSQASTTAPQGMGRGDDPDGADEGGGDMDSDDVESDASGAWPEPETSASQPVRPIRRTRTLGDLVQPGRPPVVRSQPRPATSVFASSTSAPGTSGTASAHETSAAGSSGRHVTTEADVAALDLALARTLDEDAAATAELPVAGATEAPAASPAERSVSGVATKPIPALGPFVAQIARRGPLAPGDGADEAPSEGERGESGEDTDAFRRFLRAARRGTPQVLWRVVLAHAMLGLALALVASTLLLMQALLGGWVLLLAALALASGGLAYGLLASRPAARFAPLALVAAHLGALAWLFLLLGPRPALLVLVAPVVVLDLRAGGRWAALTAGTGALALYIGFQVAATRGLPAPALTLAASDQVTLDTGAVVLGLTCLLVGIIAVADGRERSDAAARARLYEVRLQRGQVIRLRGELERSGQVLDEALVRALRGRGLDPISVDGPLSLVAEDVNAIAERLRTLQKDREDRLRLEGAIRALTRVLERARVSLPWNWPERSDTMLDEVVTLLRAPRAQGRSVEAYARTAPESSGSWLAPVPAPTSNPQAMSRTPTAAPPSPPSPPSAPSWPPTIESFPGAGFAEPAAPEAEPPSQGINVRDLLDEW